MIAVHLGKTLSALLDFAREADGIDRAPEPLLTFAVVGTRPNGSEMVVRLWPEILMALGVMDHPSETPGG